jgi:hypothetical protein
LSSHLLLPLLFAGVLLGFSGATSAEEMPVFRIEMKDGTIEPTRIEVPAGKPFKLEIHNLGNAPAEFESLKLKKEKVLAPQTSANLVFRRVAPGEYDFFDDFHPDARAVLVAK